MDYSVLENCSLFSGVSVSELKEVLEETPYHILSFDPCDIIALEPTALVMFRKEDLLALMQKDVRILENLTTEIGSATYMLQQRLELFSYSGIAQKAAYWLLMQERQKNNNKIHIPGSISKWAMIMNVSRTSLHRELKRLENQSVISYTPPVITILDSNALIDVLS